MFGRFLRSGIIAGKRQETLAIVGAKDAAGEEASQFAEQDFGCGFRSWCGFQMRAPIADAQQADSIVGRFESWLQGEIATPSTQSPVFLGIARGSFVRRNKFSVGQLSGRVGTRGADAESCQTGREQTNDLFEAILRCPTGRIVEMVQAASPDVVAEKRRGSADVTGACASNS